MFEDEKDNNQNFINTNDLKSADFSKLEDNSEPIFNMGERPSVIKTDVVRNHIDNETVTEEKPDEKTESAETSRFFEEFVIKQRLDKQKRTRIIVGVIIIVVAMRFIIPLIFKLILLN